MIRSAAANVTEHQGSALNDPHTCARALHGQYTAQEQLKELKTRLRITFVIPDGHVALRHVGMLVLPQRVLCMFVDICFGHMAAHLLHAKALPHCPLRERLAFVDADGGLFHRHSSTVTDPLRWQGRSGLS